MKRFSFARMPRSAALIAVFAVFSMSCQHTAEHERSAGQWFKGNTHAHTVLCGHADSTPEHVTQWYHDHGYNFLILSEHNIFIDPAEVAMPPNKRDDFILVPGEEVTGDLKVHATAVNVHGLVDWKTETEDKTEILQTHVHRTQAAGGETILNHPNWKLALLAKDIRPVKGLHMFELYNGGGETGLEEHEGHPGTEAMWDDLLSSGMRMYGVAADDAHKFQNWSFDQSNPGRAWVMVRAAALDADALTRAMAEGDFYASSGVLLRELSQRRGKLRIRVDRDKTYAAIRQPETIGSAFDGAAPKWQIEFIGLDGRLLQKSDGPLALFASFPLARAKGYVRCKVTLTTTTTHGLRQFYAWTQPVFLDGR